MVMKRALAVTAPTDEGSQGRGILLFLFLPPLFSPLILFVISSAYARAIVSPPLLLLVVSYLIFLFLFCLCFLCIRVLHFSILNSILLRFQRKYQSKKENISDHAFSLFNDSAVKGMLADIFRIQENELQRIVRKYSRQSSYWQFDPGFITTLAASAATAVYIRDTYKKDKDHMSGTRVGIILVYYDCAELEIGSCREQYDWYSRFTEQLYATVSPYGGMLYAFDEKRVAIVFSNDWDARGTAVRTLKAARAVQKKLKSDRESPSFLLVADYLPVVEGVWSGSGFLRYFLSAAKLSRYMELFPELSSPAGPALKISSYLVKLVKGGTDA